MYDTLDLAPFEPVGRDGFFFKFPTHQNQRDRALERAYSSLQLVQLDNSIASRHHLALVVLQPDANGLICACAPHRAHYLLNIRCGNSRQGRFGGPRTRITFHRLSSLGAKHTTYGRKTAITEHQKANVAANNMQTNRPLAINSCLRQMKPLVGWLAGQFGLFSRQSSYV